MIIMKRFISILLLVAMCAFCLISCNNESDNSSAESVGGAVVNEFVNEDGNYVPRHEVKDMGGRTFTVIVKGPMSGTYQSDDFTTESEMYGELIEDAVQRRNDLTVIRKIKI